MLDGTHFQEFCHMKTFCQLTITKDYCFHEKKILLAFSFESLNTFLSSRIIHPIKNLKNQKTMS